MILFLLSACAAHVRPAEVSAITALSGDPGGGPAVWKEHCAECHGDDGSRMTKRPLPVLAREKGDAAVVHAILAGPSIMPSYKGELTPQQIADVTAWLRAGMPR